MAGLSFSNLIFPHWMIMHLTHAPCLVSLNKDGWSFKGHEWAFSEVKPIEKLKGERVRVAGWWGSKHC